LGSQRFLNNGEIKMALGDWLQMQQSISATLRISKVVPRWETSVSMIKDYGAKIIILHWNK